MHDMTEVYFRWDSDNILTHTSKPPGMCMKFKLQSHFELQMSVCLWLGALWPGVPWNGQTKVWRAHSNQGCDNFLQKAETFLIVKTAREECTLIYNNQTTEAKKEILNISTPLFQHVKNLINIPYEREESNSKLKIT